MYLCFFSVQIHGPCQRGVRAAEKLSTALVRHAGLVASENARPLAMNLIVNPVVSTEPRCRLSTSSPRVSKDTKTNEEGKEREKKTFMATVSFERSV